MRARFMALLVSFLLWGSWEEERGLVLLTRQFGTIEGNKALDGRGHVLVVGYTDDLLEERSEGFSDTFLLCSVDPKEGFGVNSP